ncbi:MAG: 30S ribosome-binding factor RbfA [Pseudomonadota bacterium]
MNVPARLPYKRAERVSDLLRQILSEILMSRVHHLGLEGVTVTGVKMTDDLQQAHVFYRVFDQAKRVEVARQLKKSAGLLRKEASHELKMRHSPVLTFEYDESLEYGHRIDELLAQIPPRSEEE